MAPDVFKNKIKLKFNCTSAKSHRKKINKNPKRCYSTEFFKGTNYRQMPLKASYV